MNDDMMEHLPAKKLRGEFIQEINEEMHRKELEDRRLKGHQLIPFGIPVLDIMTSGGMEPGDLVLVSGKSAHGKTELLTSIFKASCEKKKRVLYVALESKEFDIYRRIKYKYISVARNRDSERLKYQPDFTQWSKGQRIDLDKYEEEASGPMENLERYGSFRSATNGELFTVDEILSDLELVKDQFDLFIFDHFHMISFGREEYPNQSLAIRKLRAFALKTKKPIILACHLRKSETKSQSIIPSRAEIMGSSDLSKIATMVLFLEKNNQLKAKLQEAVAIPETKTATLFRFDKFRDGGNREMFLPLVFFDSTEGRYENNFKLGTLSHQEDDWIPLDENQYPQWAYPYSEEAKKYLRPIDMTIPEDDLSDIPF